MSYDGDMKTKLPSHLFDAYDWTESAGELEELAGLVGAELDRYVAESERNAQENAREFGVPCLVTASDLRELAEWLAADAAEAGRKEQSR
jgi:hypothetical protein